MQKRREFLKNTAKFGGGLALASSFGMEILNASNVENKTTKREKMKTALILNGSKKFWGDGTRLNFTLHEFAKNELQANGYKVLETIIDKGYEPKAEI